MSDPFFPPSATRRPPPRARPLFFLSPRAVPAGRGRDVVWTWLGRGWDAVGTRFGRGLDVVGTGFGRGFSAVFLRSQHRSSRDNSRTTSHMRIPRPSHPPPQQHFPPPRPRRTNPPRSNRRAPAPDATRSTQCPESSSPPPGIHYRWYTADAPLPHAARFRCLIPRRPRFTVRPDQPLARAIRGCMAERTIGVCLLGCGTVGGGVASILLRQRELLRARAPGSPLKCAMWW